LPPQLSEVPPSIAALCAPADAPQLGMGPLARHAGCPTLACPLLTGVVGRVLLDRPPVPALRNPHVPPMSWPFSAPSPSRLWLPGSGCSWREAAPGERGAARQLDGPAAARMTECSFALVMGWGACGGRSPGRAWCRAAAGRACFEGCCYWCRVGRGRRAPGGHERAVEGVVGARLWWSRDASAECYCAVQEAEDRACGNLQVMGRP